MTDSEFHPETRTGIGRSLATTLLCSIWVCLGAASIGLGQGVPSSRLPNHPASPRPGVIRTETTTNGKSCYTIVGAVQRSGVYETTESTITLDRLIEAAGGIVSDANPTLRVVRGGQLRFQVYYDPSLTSPETRLLPGDIVIAPSIPGSNIPATIPVACLGLLDTPVVLPLDPSIQTLSELTARLLQSPEVANNARVISPTGETQKHLVAGSVILFPPALINRLPLQQPGALPPPMELKTPEVSITSSGVSAQLVSASVPENSEMRSRESSSAQPLLAPAEGASETPSAASVVAPLQLKAPAISAPPDLPFPNSESHSTAHSAAPARTSTNIVQPPPAMTAMQMAPATGGIPVLELPYDYDSGAPAGHPFSSPNVDGVPESLVHRSPTISPGMRNPNGSLFPESNTSIRTAAVENTPRWLQQDLIPAVKEGDRETDSFDSILAVAGAKEGQSEPGTFPVQTRAKPVKKSRSPAILVLGITLFLSGAIGIAFYLAQRKFDEMELAKEHAEAQLADAPGGKTNGAASASEADTVIPDEPATGHSGIEDLVQRRVPMVEVPVEVPSQWPLQGHVTGHRRLVINSAHSTLAGPHFQTTAPADSEIKLPRRRNSRSKVDERILRRELRNVVAQLRVDPNPQAEEQHQTATPVQKPELKPTPVVSDSPAPAVSIPSSRPETIPAPHLTVSQVSAIDTEKDYDIVEPELNFPPPKSPLERALRTLASEKRA